MPDPQVFINNDIRSDNLATQSNGNYNEDFQDQDENKTNFDRGGDTTFTTHIKRKQRGQFFTLFFAIYFLFNLYIVVWINL